jgi:hypothetical protein
LLKNGKGPWKLNISAQNVLHCVPGAWKEEKVSTTGNCFRTMGPGLESNEVEMQNMRLMYQMLAGSNFTLVQQSVLLLN